MEEQTLMEPSTAGKSSTAVDFISRRELFDITRRATAFKISYKLEFLKEELIKQFNPIDMPAFNEQYSSFCKEFMLRWEKVGRHEKRFLNRNEDWLNTLITFLPEPKNHVPHNLLFKDSKDCPPAQKYPIRDDTSQIKLTSSRSVSKKRKLTSEDNSKDRPTVKKYPNRNDTTQIKSTTSRSVSKKHKLTAADDSKYCPIEQKCPNRDDTTQIKFATSGSVSKINKLTAQEALCLLLDAELSAYQYNVLRKYTPEIYPPLSVVLKAKQPVKP